MWKPLWSWNCLIWSILRKQGMQLNLHQRIFLKAGCFRKSLTLIVSFNKLSPFLSCFKSTTSENFLLKSEKNKNKDPSLFYIIVSPMYSTQNTTIEVTANILTWIWNFLEIKKYTSEFCFIYNTRVKQCLILWSSYRLSMNWSLIWVIYMSQ